ncbi:MAG: AAA family ATPase [Rhizobium sp.]|nr:AAA family ATPase [Rhizobium sp.]
MIKKITIGSFKSLEDVELDLGRVNVFIGANGSGKSNLLEALGVLGAAASGRVDDESLLRRGVRPGVPALYKTSFRGGRLPKDIRFSASSECATYSVGLFNPLERPKPAWSFNTELLKEGEKKVFGRSARSLERLNSISGYAALKVVDLPSDSPAVDLIESLREYAIFSPDTATLRGLDSDPQSREPVGLSGGRLAEAVNEMFGPGNPSERVSDDVYFSILKLIGWARGLGASPAGTVPISKSVPQQALILRFRDKYMAERRNYLSAYDASEGALYVLFMAVLAHHRSAPNLLAVDNFDHALNPRLARSLTRELVGWVKADSARQILLTSHNPLVLDGLPIGDDEVRLFAVDRTRLGRTVVTRIELDGEMVARAKKGVSLSQQWVMGALGGVPTGV